MLAEVDSTRDRVWFITGVSTGFGRAIAEVALSRGCRVVGSVRREEQVVSFEKLAPGRARAVSFDVARASAIAPAVGAATAAFGQIDVLVNNAGYALLGALEELSDDQIRQQMETNFFGAVSITRALLPHMRLRRTGHIVYITSVGGFVGGPGWSAYCASKFALEGLVDCLALEVGPLGLHVMTVEPGAFRTNLGSSGTTHVECLISDYDASVGKTREWRATSAGRESGDPMKAAEAIYNAVSSSHPPRRLVLGDDALQAVRSKLDYMKKELADWAAVSMGTSFQ